MQYILWDLGGVFYGVDYQRTIRAFEKLAMHPIPYSQEAQDEIFSLFEVGKISPQAFIQALKEKFFPSASPKEIQARWNAMLLGPLPTTSLLPVFAQKFSMALLSNTNALHWQIVRPQLEPFSGYFQKIFASHEIHLRKPTPEAFLYALEALGWEPSKTLFVDDSPQHVEGARRAGLHSFHLRNLSEFSTLCRELGLPCVVSS
ncbi:MAG: HAD family hydrolase [Bacteroidia bacterium]